jgi:acyl carrier protein phosphodiesterase
MNFLAHLFLSGNDEDILTGNLLGDFMKGRKINSFSDSIIKGIVIHRKIDVFTDNHPLVIQTKQRLRPDFKHFSPVIADVYYDHFLASNWNDYSNLPLKEFANWCYSVLRKHKDLFPPRFQQALIYMRFRNLLFSYAKISGINFAFERLSKRTDHNSNLNNATKELMNNYEFYYAEFKVFFPELQNYVKGII